MTGSLTKSAVRGVTWFGIAQIMAQVLRFASMIILARLLAPADFGAVAAAAIAQDLLLQLGDFGFSEAIVQRKNITSAHLSTSFWLGLGFGILFCILTVGISPVMGVFFRNELVGRLLAVSSVTFLIAPLRFVHGSLMRKELQFFRFSFADIGQSLVYVAATVAMAFAGLGAWSLILGGIAGQIALCILRWVLRPWRPSFLFKVQCVKDLWGFGLNLTGTRIVQFVGGKSDSLIVGRYLTVATLGFYNMAGKIPGLISQTMFMTLQRVAFPTFSVIQDEDERLRRGFIMSQTYISMLVLPLFVGLAIVTPELVRVVFGEKWTPSIVPMEILCITALASSLSVTAGPVARAKGRPDLELKIGLLGVGLIVPSLLVGIRFGMVGIAAGTAVTNVMVWLAIQVVANRVIGLRIKDYLYSLGPAVFGSVVMALAMLGFRFAGITMLKLADVWLLIGSGLLGVVVYLAVLKASRIQALDEMVDLGLEVVMPFAGWIMAKMPWAQKKVAHVGPDEEEQKHVLYIYKKKW